jgi:hypothetical protein
MAKPAMPFLAAVLALAAAGMAGPAAASVLMYSYDSTTPVTQTMTENGITLMLQKSFLRLRVLRLVETLDIGSAELKPASEDELGRGGLREALGRDAEERDLYEITLKDDGRALTNALCRGADKAFLAFGPIRQDQNLRVRALARDPATGKARLCVTLDYAFHGVWTLPPVDLPQPDRTDPFEQSPANRRY